MKAAVGPLALGLMLAGCASSPRVDYHRFAEPERADSWVPYRLTDTTVVIGAILDKGGTGPAEGDRPGQPISLAESDAKCAAGACVPAMAAIAAPIDDEGEVLALAPRSRALVSTYLAPTYWPNSLRLKMLSIEVRDHKLEAINAAGAIAVGVGKMAATGGVRGANGADPDARTLHLPIVADLSALKGGGQVALTGANKGWYVSGDFLDAAIEKAGFIPRAAAGRVHGAMLTSTCRPMSILITDLKKEQITFRVRVADPDWLTPIPLPSMGAVALHPLCGADVQNQKVVEVGVDAMAQAFFTQVDAVRKATK